MYATAVEFQSKFGVPETVALTNLETIGAVAVDLPTLEQTLMDVTAEIDGYVGARYALPLPSTPSTLRAAACDMARYRLDRNLQREDVRLRYEDWIKFLRDVAAGRASLGLPASDQSPPVAPQGQVGDRPRYFRNSLSGRAQTGGGRY
ncbi:MAG: DUF1320 domain-containing protein [Spirulinaceae cyanobacterium SM2_1_0]|nr:DUF1320 domain-containing protein [Spirulinaceae cyanobacterium SM2_1_0]